MIRLDALRCGFGSFELGPLSLRIGDGQYWVLLGPSGAGKSMLLQTIAGLHRPDDGEIQIDGESMVSVSPEQRNIGLVFQQAALFPHMSVAHNIAYGLRARGIARAEREARVAEVVETLRIESLLARPVATLSGGEAQKVAIARALAPRPRLLLLDEPLGAIDHNARTQLQDELTRLHETLSLTILHVTHSRMEARALGSHTALLLDGRFVQQGPTAELLAAPRCFWAAHFLGADTDSAGTPPCGKSCLNSPSHCDLPLPTPGA